MIEVLRKIWCFAGEEQRNIRKSMVLGFFYAIFHMFQIAAIYVVVLALVDGSTSAAPAWQALALLLVSILGRAIMNRFSQLQQTHAGYFMVANKRLHMGDKLKRIPMGYFNDQSLGELTGIATTILDEVESAGAMVLVTILGGLINSAVMLLCVLFWDWRIGLLALAGMALLKIAQKCDSYLAALGLSVAQTGSSMGMEMLMAARVLTGFSRGGGGNAASVFGGGARGGAGAAAGTAGGVAAGGILSGFMNRYRPNSFVRDAVVDGGSRMGAGGGVGFVGRAFGGMAARNGATLTPNSISSVATRPPSVSGTIGGEIADRSIPGYMPQLAGGATANMTYSGTQITGGHISTTATAPDGRQAKVDLYSTAQHEAPSTPHTVVTAADGSQWYQVASGEGMGAFYATPAFTGDVSEAAQVAEAFPSAPDGTLLRQVDEGTLEASYPDGGNSLWYNSAYFQEPDAPHEVIQGADGLSWYAMTPAAAVPEFEPETPAPSGGGLSPSAQYNAALFGQFMPGFDQPVVSVDSSRSADGILEVRHEDGTGTAFYDRTMYQAPRGDYHVFEDSGGSQWYAIPGTPAVERRPVYEDGRPVYDGDKLQTTTVETMRYKSTPSRHTQPQKRPVTERKPPNRKKP